MGAIRHAAPLRSVSLAERLPLLGARVGIGWEPAGGDGLDLKVVVVPMGKAGRLILGPCPGEGW